MPFIALAPFILSAAPAFTKQTLAAEFDGAPLIDTSDPAASLKPDQTLPSNDIVVIAGRLEAQVNTPQAPIVTLNDEDIAAYGAASISELLAALSPEAGSGSGRGGGPVILRNGQRISNLNEIRSYPTEAIRRVEVLPEQVALRYGYPANQRVINIVLKNSFSSNSIEAEYSQPDRGGSYTGKVGGTVFRLDGPHSFNINLTGSRTTPLTEAERDVVQLPETLPTVAGDPNPAESRTLLPYSRNLGVNGSWSTPLGEGDSQGSIRLNAAINRSDTYSLMGLNSVTLTAPDGTMALRTFGDSLRQSSHTTTIQGGAALAKPLGGWKLEATLDASHAETDTSTDRLADTSALVAAGAAGTLPIDGLLPPIAVAGAYSIKSRNDSITSLVTVAGKPFSLPAGDVAMTFKGGFAYTGFASSSTLAGSGESSLHRGDLSAGISVELPLTSRRKNVLAGIGDITLDLSAGLNRISDFGTLTNWNAGVVWGLTNKLSLQASYTMNQAAPAMSALSSPLITSYNVPVYDFATGETVLVTTFSGGNSSLQRETQRDLRLGANWTLPFAKRSNLIVEYFRNSSSNVDGAFPLLTPKIEAAFTGRVVRDSNGHIVSIDQRPVPYFHQGSSRLRYGVNLFGTFGQSKPDGSLRSNSPGASSSDNSAGPGPAAARLQGAQGRWNLSIYHTVQLSSLIEITPDGPALNLLGGDAASGGGLGKHSFELEGGIFYKGIGLRLSGSYTSSTNVRASGLAGDSNLHYGALATFNLRVFANLGEVIHASPFFKGARLSLRVDNIFAAHQKVTDQSGAVPLSFQRDRIDPRGRVIAVSVRKMF